MRMILDLSILVDVIIGGVEKVKDQESDDFAFYRHILYMFPSLEEK